MPRFYFDVESIATTRADIRDDITARALDAAAAAEPPKKITELKDPKLRDPRMIEWRTEQYDKASAAAIEQHHATGLSGDYGELVCICLAVDDGPIQTFSRATTEEDEGVLLAQFYLAARRAWDAADRRQIEWVGHNVPFDLSFLHHRSIVLGVRPTVRIPHGDAPWKGSYFDTMTEWAGLRDRIKLTELCRVLGIAVHDQIDGSQVDQAFREGRIDQIAEHCQADVERVRQIERRMRWASS